MRGASTSLSVWKRPLTGPSSGFRSACFALSRKRGEGFRAARQSQQASEDRRRQLKCACVPSYEPWNAERAAEIISAHLAWEGPLLPILHALQEAFGHVPANAVTTVAEALNLSRAEVHGVVTFYHDFRQEPAGRHVLKLCRAEACQAAGGDALAAHAQAKLGVPIGDTTADRSVTLEPVYCLGLCATAPAAMLDGHVVGRLDATRLDALLAEARR
jgi:formate dehydrogenase subunit gamma